MAAPPTATATATAPTPDAEATNDTTNPGYSAYEANATATRISHHGWGW